MCIVVYLLKVRTVESEKRPLLVSASETFISRQRLDKHIPRAIDKYEIIEMLLETVFYTRSMKGVIRKKILGTKS
jgi:hypothetical protein